MPLSEDSKSYRLNHQILQNRWPGVWHAIRGKQAEANFIETPEPTIVVSGIQLSSGADQKREARVQLEELPDEPDQIWIYGVGSGELANEAIREFSEIPVHQVVLNRASFAKALQLKDQTDWLRAENLELQLGKNLSQLQQPFVVSPGSLRVSDPDSVDLRDTLYLELNRDYSNRRRRRDYSVDQWDETYFERLRTFDSLEYLVEGFDSDSCIVAAAGPTLSDQLPWISNMQDAGTAVVGVDTALKPLSDAGIIPDYAVVTDPTENNIERFEFDLSDFSEIPLVVVPYVQPDILERWPGPIYLSAPFEKPEQIPDEQKWLGKLYKLFAGSSVTHAAVDFAVSGGTKTVYLAGADFGFPEQKQYASGALTTNSLRDITTRVAPDMKIENGYGEQIPTDFSLRRYRRVLEQYIQKVDDVDFVNRSRRGARIKGARYEP